MTLRVANIRSQQSNLGNASSTSFLSDSEESQGFTVLNSASEAHRANLLELKREYHPDGYLLAMPNIVKLISSSAQAIGAAGGRPFKREGMGFMEVKSKATGLQVKELSLANGKLKVYKRFDEAAKAKEMTIHIQRIHQIRYLSKDATNFFLSFTKKKSKKRGMLRSMSNVAGNFTRNSGRIGSLRKGRNSKRLSSRADAAKKAKRASVRSSKRMQKKTIKKKAAKRTTTRELDTPMFKLNSRSEASEVHKDLLLPDDNSPTGLAVSETEEMEFKFNSKEECHEWLIGIIVQVENQARLFENFAKRMRRKSDNYEIVLRRAIDLMTVARGVRDVEVWRMREMLATFLRNDGREEEARIWYNLSFPVRQEVSILDLIENAEFSRKMQQQGLTESRNGSLGSFGSMINVNLKKEKLKLEPPTSKASAIEQLTIFFETFAHSDSVKTATDEAIALVNTNSYLGIARLLEAKYSRVPEGFEFFLIAAAKTPLEEMRLRAEDYDDDLEV